MRAALTLRVNPDIDPRSHPYISTGLKENKFGVDIARAPGILERARGLRGVEIIGLQVLKPLGLPVILEPGRSLVARAGVLLPRVLYVKENQGRRFVIVDAGMNDLLRPALKKTVCEPAPGSEGQEARRE